MRYFYAVLFAEKRRFALIDTVVSVVEHNIAGYQRGVKGVGDEHISGPVAHQHFCYSCYVADKNYQQKEEAFAFSCSACP